LFMTRFFVAIFVLSDLFLSAQTLNLPARQVSALSGSQFEQSIVSVSLSLTSREDMIYAQVAAGNVPDFYRTLVPVTSTAVVQGVSQSVTYYVSPDYLAIGCDSDYFLCPMSPMLDTRIGALLACTLPTRKMVGDIWKAATVKLAPQPLPPTSYMSTVPYFDKQDSLVDTQRATFFPTYPLGQLTSGDKKDVIISNLIYSIANRVIIFGWYYTNGTYIQPMTNVHDDIYMDYSHGNRLVQNSCMLNGTLATTIQFILGTSPLDSILSDEGVISQPWYPYIVSTGVEGESAQPAPGFRVFPNPIHEWFTFAFNSPPDPGSFFRICDLQGRVLKEEKLNQNGQQRINCEGISAGMYLLSVSGPAYVTSSSASMCKTKLIVISP
jgi:hypothetical protein